MLALKNASRIRIDISRIHAKYEESSLRVFLLFILQETSSYFLSIREIIRKWGPGCGVHPRKHNRANKNPKEVVSHTAAFLTAPFVITKPSCQGVGNLCFLPCPVSHFRQEAVALTKWRLSETKQRGSCLRESQAVETGCSRQNEAEKPRMVTLGEVHGSSLSLPSHRGTCIHFLWLYHCVRDAFPGFPDGLGCPLCVLVALWASPLEHSLPPESCIYGYDCCTSLMFVVLTHLAPWGPGTCLVLAHRCMCPRLLAQVLLNEDLQWICVGWMN